jgi:hypothetical protein
VVDVMPTILEAVGIGESISGQRRIPTRLLGRIWWMPDAQEFLRVWPARVTL